MAFEIAATRAGAAAGPISRNSRAVRHPLAPARLQSSRIQNNTRKAGLILSARYAVAAQAVNGDGNGAAAAKPDKRLKPFTNTNKFLVPEKCQFQFELEWKKREQDMNLYTGFEGLTIKRNGDEYTTCSSWATIYDWEDWSCSIHHRRSHLPVGVCQYPPKKGTGFPESFVPLVGLTDAPMMAQY